MFDIGVNLTSSQFARDHDEVVARARSAGVHGMLLTGTNLPESQQAQRMASHYAGCWSTAGFIPMTAAAGRQRSPRRFMSCPRAAGGGDRGMWSGF